MKNGKGQTLYNKAKSIIPGGTQLLSKRPEMFLPDYWPAYYSKAKGCKIWDLDGNEYTDTSYMGIGANILGYSDDDVDNAVKEAITNGTMTTLNAPEEVELAEILTDIHPWADMVRYARAGGEAMSIAVRIARAKTNKDIILFCGYHGWTDWYLAANINSDKALDGHLLPGLSSLGVPRGLKGTVIPFNYNNTTEYLELLNKYKGQIAAVVMEPIRNSFPENDFLEVIRETTRENEIVLVVDEITAGWRLNIGGAHLNLGIEPDMAIFGKGISNGYPLTAIIGRREIMELAQDTFISSTFWTERIGPVAAIASIKKMIKNNVPAHLDKVGKTVQSGWKKAASKYNLNISIGGILPLSHFSFNYENNLAVKTLFTQLMLDKGYLATTAMYASYAHKDSDISGYLEAVNESFETISKAIESNSVEKLLRGPVCHSGFKRLT